MAGMKELMHDFLLAWIPLFVAMDPIGLVPLFLGMTRDVPPDRVRIITRQAVLTAGLVAVGFMFLGKFTFAALGITVADFQVAGGLILLVLAGRDLAAPAKEPAPPSEDFGVVPLGLPLITGPGTLAALLILVESPGPVPTLAALGCNLFLVFIALRFGIALKRLIGVTGLKAASKIMSLLLAAIAVHMIRKGWLGT